MATRLLPAERFPPHRLLIDRWWHGPGARATFIFNDFPSRRKGGRIFKAAEKAAESSRPPKGGGIFKAAEKAALQGRTTS
jgi:hypothetical protein